MRGFGCSKCNMTSGEKRVFNFLKINKIKNIFQHTFYGCVGIKRKLPFDFYLPDFDLFIEVKGYQTERDLQKWGSVKNLVVFKLDEIKKIKNNNLKIVDIYKIKIL